VTVEKAVLDFINARRKPGGKEPLAKLAPK
jgi:hypothetical protein